MKEEIHEIHTHSNEISLERVYEDESFTIVSPSGEDLLTSNNSLVLDSIRLEIAQKKLKGYSVKFKNINYPINEYGKINPWPYNLCDKSLVILRQLFYIKENGKRNAR